MDDDYNQRQYRQMLHALDSYKSGTIGLGTLTSRLEALRRVVENVPGDWASQFETEWSVLEMTCALGPEKMPASGSDPTIDELVEPDRRYVNEAIAALRKLVRSAAESSLGRS